MLSILNEIKIIIVEVNSITKNESDKYLNRGENKETTPPKKADKNQNLALSFAIKAVVKRIKEFRNILTNSVISITTFTLSPYL